MHAHCSTCSSRNSDLASGQCKPFCKPLFNHTQRDKATYNKHVSKIKMSKLTVLAYICHL